MDPHQLLMQETPHQLKRKGRQMGMINNTEGQIIQVQGGRIIRSTGRKDRHSKVYTAKGPRDRRVRLSAHTAIQFYDVQDRLGFDRPSKAVDWLISKAKSAIDNLAELPSSGANYVPQQWDSIGFEGYPDRKSQDLCLSLQSNFQGQTETGSGSRSGSGQTQGLFMGSFEGAGSSGWVGQDEPGMGRLSRLFEWDGSSGSCYGTLTNMVQQGGMMLGQHDGTSSSSSSLSSMLCHGNQRGTLQSSAWNHHHHHHHQMSMGVDVSGSDGFMGFCIPANMNGDDHHHHEHVNKASTSSMSPNSSHERV